MSSERDQILLTAPRLLRKILEWKESQLQVFPAEFGVFIYLHIPAGSIEIRFWLLCSPSEDTTNPMLAQERFALAKSMLKFQCWKFLSFQTLPHSSAEALGLTA